MEHVVFFPDADGTEAFRRAADLEEAVRLVERLRNDLGVGDASVYALHPVPLAFRTYVHVELPVGESSPESGEPVEAEPTTDETTAAQIAASETDGAAEIPESDEGDREVESADVELAEVEQLDAASPDSEAPNAEVEEPVEPAAELAEPSIPPPPSEPPAEFQHHVEDQPEAEVDVDTEAAIESPPPVPADFFEPIDEFEPTEYAFDALAAGGADTDQASAFDAAEWETAAQEPQDHADDEHASFDDTPDQLELVETAGAADVPAESAESAVVAEAESAEAESAEAESSEAESSEAESSEAESSEAESNEPEASEPEHADLEVVEAAVADAVFDHDAAQQQVTELAAEAEHAGHAESDALPETTADEVVTVTTAEQVAPDGDIAVTPYRSSPAELPPLTLAPGPLLFDGDDQPIVSSGSYDAVEEAPAELTDLIPANFTDLIPKDIVHGSLHSDVEAQAEQLPELAPIESPVAGLVPEAPIEEPPAEWVPEAPVEAPLAELTVEAAVEAPVEALVEAPAELPAELPAFEGEPAPSTDELPPMDVPEVPSDVSGIEMLDAAEIPAARENAETSVPPAAANTGPRGLGYFGG